MGKISNSVKRRIRFEKGLDPLLPGLVNGMDTIISRAGVMRCCLSIHTKEKMENKQFDNNSILTCEFCKREFVLVNQTWIPKEWTKKEGENNGLLY